jgi:predicted ArsR family transcriptional regulator
MARRYADALVGLAPEERASRLAELLTADGFAAATDTGPLGGQICQHHCPVAHVAAEFPELCDAETRVFADLLGTHVQRLATIAHGDHLCTTNVPHQAAPHHTAAAVSDRKAAG